MFLLKVIAVISAIIIMFVMFPTVVLIPVWAFIILVLLKTIDILKERRKK